MATAEEIVEFARRYSDFELAPWQIEFLQHVAAGKSFVLQPGRSSAGRAQLDQLLKDVYRRLGYEVIELEGVWTARLPCAD